VTLAVGSVVAEAGRSLLAHPLRSLLTLLSVAFGAAVLLVLLAFATGVPDATTSILRSLGGKELVVEAGRMRGSGGAGNRGGRQVRIRYVDLSAIREACPSIAALAPTFDAGRGGPAFALSRSWPWARLRGVGYEYAAVTDLAITAGRWFTREEEHLASDVALISQALCEGLFEGRSPLGESIDSGSRRFEIVGVYESSLDFAYSLFVPYTTAMDLGDSDGRYVSSLAFEPRRPDLAKDAVAEIRTALGSLYSFDPADDRAIDVKENIAYAERIEATSRALQALVILIAAIALVLGCLGAANVVGIAVSERTAELGLRRAVGATAARIRAEVLTETLLLSILGGAAGVGLGWLAATALGPLEFTPQAILVPTVDARLLAALLPLLVITATLAGLPAAGRAARVHPAEALRAE
jgi:ABC-type antimicrobial peptide transport system permease subunit